MASALLSTGCYGHLGVTQWMGELSISFLSLCLFIFQIDKMFNEKKHVQVKKLCSNAYQNFSADTSSICNVQQLSINE